MNDLIQAAEMALEALENVPIEYDFHGKPMDAEFGEQLETTLQALRQALAPPNREWVGLTNDEIDNLNLSNKIKIKQLILLIETKLKEKNLCR